MSDLLAAVANLNRRLDDKLEVVFVVDGSPDRSYTILAERLPRLGVRAKLLLLSRNFGSFAAIRAGLAAGRGEFFAVMAADLQEPPDLIERFFSVLKSGEFDVVVGTRESRADPWLARLASRIFWKLYRSLVVKEIPQGGVDVFGCNREFRDRVLELRESHSSLVALMFWLGFRRQAIAYTRLARRHGRSAWTLRKKVKYLLDSVFAFTDLPIRLLMGAGIFGIGVSFLLGSAILVSRLLGNIPVPGYAATALLITFFGGLNTFGIGLVGNYAWRSYENSKLRPLAIIMRETSYPPTELMHSGQSAS